MKELVETIAKALVDSPDEVVVTQTVKHEREIVIQLHVAPGRYGQGNWKAGKNCKGYSFSSKGCIF